MRFYAKRNTWPAAGAGLLLLALIFALLDARLGVVLWGRGWPIFLAAGVFAWLLFYGVTGALCWLKPEYEMLVLDEEGVLEQGLFQSHRLKWSDIDGFEVFPGTRFQPERVGIHFRTAVSFRARVKAFARQLYGKRALLPQGVALTGVLLHRYAVPASVLVPQLELWRQRARFESRDAEADEALPPVCLNANLRPVLLFAMLCVGLAIVSGFSEFVFVVRGGAFKGVILFVHFCAFALALGAGGLALMLLNDRIRFDRVDGIRLPVRGITMEPIPWARVMGIGGGVTVAFLPPKAVVAQEEARYRDIAVDDPVWHEDERLAESLSQVLPKSATFQCVYGLSSVALVDCLNEYLEDYRRRRHAAQQVVSQLPDDAVVLGTEGGAVRLYPKKQFAGEWPDALFIGIMVFILPATLAGEWLEPVGGALISPVAGIVLVVAYILLRGTFAILVGAVFPQSSYLQLDHEGLTERRFFRKRRIPWAEIVQADAYILDTAVHNFCWDVCFTFVPSVSDQEDKGWRAFFQRSLPAGVAQVGMLSNTYKLSGHDLVQQLNGWVMRSRG